MSQNDVKNNSHTDYNSSLYKGVSRGYYSTNLCNWKNNESLIQKDANGLYSVSNVGLEYLKNPKSLRYQNAKRRIDRLQYNLNWYMDNSKHNNNYQRAINLSSSEVWRALEFYKIQGFRDELTSDKRYYVDCMIDFIEQVVDHEDMIQNLGNNYVKERDACETEFEIIEKLCDF